MRLVLAEARVVDLGLKVLHGFLKGLGRGSLVVTQDGHGAVGSVVRQDFGWSAVISCESNNDTTSTTFLFIPPVPSESDAYRK